MHKFHHFGMFIHQNGRKSWAERRIHNQSETAGRTQYISEKNLFHLLPNSLLNKSSAAVPPLNHFMWITVELDFFFLFLIFSLTDVRIIALVQVLIFCDVLVWDQEENHLALLILDGNYVQQTPELGAFCWRSANMNIIFAVIYMDRRWLNVTAPSPYRSSCTERSQSWTPAVRPEPFASVRWSGRWFRRRTGSGTCSSSASARRGRSRSARRSHRSSRQWGRRTGLERFPEQSYCLGRGKKTKTPHREGKDS